jgi:hypothetical protein
MSQKNVIPFTLEGDPQVYTLEFDFNAICAAEAVTGCNLMRALAGGEIFAAQTRGLLFACLKPAHPDVLLTEAGELLTRDMETVLEALSKALAGAKGTGTDEEDPAAAKTVEEK